ncbi:uncharacterized protein LOC126332765 isoform X1 [Schistocerca gregaria]|uniref:uncharacterized protein LOC126332765 isoform X1 n=1 Tax=Schistocerca gregaria TaxID=7010 RepID=UPI00211E6086|nr:uncharacterized protein LOC126332765 isoform X1 [Schistocerca gregaria]
MHPSQVVRRLSFGLPKDDTTNEFSVYLDESTPYRMSENTNTDSPSTDEECPSLTNSSFIFEDSSVHRPPIINPPVSRSPHQPPKFNFNNRFPLLPIDSNSSNNFKTSIEFNSKLSVPHSKCIKMLTRQLLGSCLIANQTESFETPLRSDPVAHVIIPPPPSVTPTKQTHSDSQPVHNASPPKQRALNPQRSPQSNVTNDEKWQALLRRRELRIRSSHLPPSSRVKNHQPAPTSLHSLIPPTHSTKPLKKAISSHVMPSLPLSRTKPLSTPSLSIKRQSSCTKFPSRSKTALPKPAFSHLENLLLRVQLLQWNFLCHSLRESLSSKQLAAEHMISSVWYKTKQLHLQLREQTSQLKRAQALRLQVHLNLFKSNCIAPFAAQLCSFFQKFQSMSHLVTKNMHSLPLVNIAPSNALELLASIQQAARLLSTIETHSHQQAKWNLISDRINSLCNLFLEEVQLLTHYFQLLQSLRVKNTHLRSLLIHKAQLTQNFVPSPT